MISDAIVLNRRHFNSNTHMVYAYSRKSIVHLPLFSLFLALKFELSNKHDQQETAKETIPKRMSSEYV